VPWEVRWIRWPDFGLPFDARALRTALDEAYERAASERVELACAGGYGRTGTMLACLVALDGVPAGEAVAYVRRHYRARAVETPWQQWFVHGFARRIAGATPPPRA
jgi:protein-tyrosine phosphatase